MPPMPPIAPLLPLSNYGIILSLIPCAAASAASHIDLLTFPTLSQIARTASRSYDRIPE